MRSAARALVIVTAALVAACTGAGATAQSSSAVPSPAASAPATVATGTFHKADGEASGTVALKHLADGSFAVVFDDFAIGSAEHTNVILVANADVKTTTDVDPTKLVDLGPLTGTSGMQDYKVPADMAAGAMGYHTVVLWDTAMKHAIAAAPLTGR
jgi:hypothetical protein